MSTKDFGSLPEIRKIVTINAPVLTVWEAIATSEGISGWWLQNNFKAIEGYKFMIHDDAFGDSPCLVTKVIAPTHLEFDWDKDWHLVFELRAIGENKTEVVFTHSGWFADKNTRFGQSHPQIRKVMDEGWENGIKTKLVKYVEK